MERTGDSAPTQSWSPTRRNSDHLVTTRRACLARTVVDAVELVAEPSRDCRAACSIRRSGSQRGPRRPAPGRAALVRTSTATVTCPCPTASASSQQPISIARGPIRRCSPMQPRSPPSGDQHVAVAPHQPPTFQVRRESLLLGLVWCRLAARPWHPRTHMIEVAGDPAISAATAGASGRITSPGNSNRSGGSSVTRRIMGRAHATCHRPARRCHPSAGVTPTMVCHNGTSCRR